ncbi:hypothetical protein SDC9_107384 [bioreactor metagenome]|uniref:Uncharacterized protein n=1 Tax=bioreactor metagenome TaxID=1076179 RepID=A0A645BBH2_9ZZZZ
MAQRHGPEHTLLINIQGLGRGDDGHGGGNPLISGTGVGNYRRVGPRHAGVRRAGGDGHRLQHHVAAHQAGLLTFADVPPYVQAEVSLRAHLCNFAVDLNGLLNHVQVVFLPIQRFHEFINCLDTQGILNDLRCDGVGGSFLRSRLQRFVVCLHQCHIGVGPPDNGAGLMLVVGQLHLYIELIRLLRPAHLHMAASHQLHGPGHILRRSAVHHLQPAFHPPAHGAQRRRVVHAGALRSRYAGSHRILDDVDAGKHLYVGRFPQQVLPGDSSGQGNRRRLRTPGSQHHLVVQNLTNQGAIHDSPPFFNLFSWKKRI